jgi:predicted permease
MKADYSSLLFMLALIVVGFILIKIRLLKVIHIDAIPVILLNVAYPALILNSVISVDINSLAKEGIAVVLVTLVITLSLFFFGIVILKKYKNKERKPLILFAMAIGNIAFVALPVIRAVFGDVGVYFTMLHNSVQDVIIWTLYYTYFVGGGNFKSITIKKFVTPSFIALIIAIVLAIFRIRPPGVIDNLLQALAGLAVPLALIYIGGVLAGHSRFKDWIPDMDTVILSVSKVFVLPLIVFGIMQFVPVGHKLKLLMAVVFSAPVPIMSTVWAKQFGYDYAFSIKALLFSTSLFLIGAGVLFMFVNIGIL